MPDAPPVTMIDLPSRVDMFRLSVAQGGT